MSKQSWHFHDSLGFHFILVSGTSSGRVVSDKDRNLLDKPYCYKSTLRIDGVQYSQTYELRLTNQYGVDTHKIHLEVIQ